MASGLCDDTIRTWDPIEDDQAVHVLEDHYGGMSGVTAFRDAQDNMWLACCSHDRMVRIWDPIKAARRSTCLRATLLGSDARRPLLTPSAKLGWRTTLMTSLSAFGT